MRVGWKLTAIDASEVIIDETDPNGKYGHIKGISSVLRPRVREHRNGAVLAAFFGLVSSISDNSARARPLRDAEMAENRRRCGSRDLRPHDFRYGDVRICGGKTREIPPFHQWTLSDWSHLKAAFSDPSHLKLVATLT